METEGLNQVERLILAEMKDAGCLLFVDVYGTHPGASHWWNRVKTFYFAPLSGLVRRVSRTKAAKMKVLKRKPQFFED